MITIGRLRDAGGKTCKTFWRLLPVLIGVLLIASLIVQLIPELVRLGLLGHGPLLEMLGADLLGSLSTGQPVVSYLLGGELRQAGIDLYAITAFIVAWVTVGIIPMPAEAVMLGWRFTLVRNLIAFIMAIVVAWITVATLNG
ncbi:MAG TPA: hypothetical protein ENJ21_00675 [Chromatiaceae bacterium]|nr:hypothetical protein [Chromatiaceae bacterium]